MLSELHVKDFALIEDARISFGEGLNIFTGETGAGKSILIDAVNAALGVKTPKTFIRKGAEEARIELVFDVTDEKLSSKLAALDASPDEDGLLIISKIIQKTRSLSRINDNAVTSARLREVTALLVNMHGQNEQQYLFRRSMHLQILDGYCAQAAAPVKARLSEVFRDHTEAQKELESLQMDESSRLRELDLLRYEINEIEQADLQEGEEEKLAELHKRFQNSRRIADALEAARSALGSERGDNASDRIGRAARELNSALTYDAGLGGICELIGTIEGLTSDLMDEIDRYMDGLSFSPEEQSAVESRLDTIRNTEAKYGRGYDEVMAALKERRDRLEVLDDIGERRAQLGARLEAVRAELDSLCEELSRIRQEHAGQLVSDILRHLSDLNFPGVRFTMKFGRLDGYTANGYDEAEFYLAANPGEDLMPLAEVASGGELSRVMLAVKTALADADEIPTLIFDEIDAGISGRAAQKVSEKLSLIGRRRQVICVTHLAQIAAMADRNFRIEKHSADGHTVTSVTLLDRSETVEELARILGGVEITDAVIQNAEEMRSLADALKGQEGI